MDKLKLATNKKAYLKKKLIDPLYELMIDKQY